MCLNRQAIRLTGGGDQLSLDMPQQNDTGARTALLAWTAFGARCFGQHERVLEVS
jgi:hypothetical protein